MEADQAGKHLDEGLAQADDVAFTDHAEERINNRMKLPKSIVENVIQKQKGRQYFDLEEETYLFMYQKTGIVVKFEDGTAVVITCYRSETPVKKSERFVRVN